MATAATIRRSIQPARPRALLERRQPPPRRTLARVARAAAPGVLSGAAAALAGRRRVRLGRLEVSRAPTPLGALLRGAAAGLAGNTAMDLTQALVYKVRGKETGQWQSWEEAPAPAQIGKRVWEGVLQRDPPPPDKIRLFNNAVHWTYGPAWAGLYGLVAASLERRRTAREGISFGLFAWAIGSGVLTPAAKLAKPPWEYGLRTNALDITYHVAYGLGTAAAFRALERRLGG